MENEDYVLLSKDDYLNVLNQQEQEHLDKDDHVDLILNSNNHFESQKEAFDYLISNDEHNENQQLNDTENSKEQQNESQMFREQDLYLPLTNISRIMKQNLPKEGKIAKEAKITVQECISEFISFIASEASDRCLAEKRKTLNGDDILYAMQTLGFDNYIEPLRIFLQKYKQLNSTSAHLSSNQESDLLNQQHEQK